MISGTVLSNPLWLFVMVGFALCSGLVAHYRKQRFWTGFLWGIVFGPLALIVELVSFVRERRR